MSSASCCAAVARGGSRVVLWEPADRAGVARLDARLAVALDALRTSRRGRRTVDRARARAGAPTGSGWRSEVADEGVRGGPAIAPSGSTRSDARGGVRRGRRPRLAPPAVLRRPRRGARGDRVRRVVGADTAGPRVAGAPDWAVGRARSGSPGAFALLAVPPCSELRGAVLGPPRRCSPAAPPVAPFRRRGDERPTGPRRGPVTSSGRAGSTPRSWPGPFRGPSRSGSSRALLPTSRAFEFRAQVHAIPRDRALGTVRSAGAVADDRDRIRRGERARRARARGGERARPRAEARRQRAAAVPRGLSFHATAAPAGGASSGTGPTSCGDSPRSGSARRSPSYQAAPPPPRLALDGSEPRPPGTGTPCRPTRSRRSSRSSTRRSPSPGASSSASSSTMPPRSSSTDGGTRATRGVSSARPAREIVRRGSARAPDAVDDAGPRGVRPRPPRRVRWSRRARSARRSSASARRPRPGSTRSTCPCDRGRPSEKSASRRGRAPARVLPSLADEEVAVLDASVARLCARAGPADVRRPRRPLASECPIPAGSPPSRRLRHRVARPPRPGPVATPPPTGSLVLDLHEVAAEHRAFQLAVVLDAIYGAHPPERPPEAPIVIDEAHLLANDPRHRRLPRPARPPRPPPPDGRDPPQPEPGRLPRDRGRPLAASATCAPRSSSTSPRSRTPRGGSSRSPTPRRGGSRTAGSPRRRGTQRGS